MKYLIIFALSLVLSGCTTAQWAAGLSSAGSSISNNSRQSKTYYCQNTFANNYQCH